MNERRTTVQLSQEQLEEIAELAASKAVDKTIEKITLTFYQHIGQTIINKLFWTIGLVTVGAFMWLKHQGYIK